MTEKEIEQTQFELRRAVKQLGIIAVYEAVMDRCCLDDKRNKEEAALFAHRVFLMTMKDWMKNA